MAYLLSMKSIFPQYKLKAQDYLCPICKKIIMAPCQTNTDCSHYFCITCLAKKVKNGPFPCPFDKIQIKFSDLSFVPGFKSIDLFCYCEFKPQGCDWNGPVDDYYNYHFKECPFRVIENDED